MGKKCDFVSEQICPELCRIKKYWKCTDLPLFVLRNTQCLLEEERLCGTCCMRAQDLNHGRVLFLPQAHHAKPLHPCTELLLSRLAQQQMANVSSESNSYLGFYKMTQAWPEPEISNWHSNVICDLKLA